MTNLSYIMPCFIVTDLKTSVSFYVDKLGFKIRYIGPDENPYWAIVGRDEISIMLKAVALEIKPIPNRSRHEWAPTDAYISSADPDKLFQEYRARGISFKTPLQNNSDGLRGFEVEDADGYLLFFGRPN
jgi:catechol 2,3-dioxygenase-like lactoylglutathione lyase family enzyme